MSFPNDSYRREGKHPAATIDEKQRSLNAKVLARAANCSQSKSDESRTGRPTFVEDFVLEHARFGQQADSRESAGCF
jgi:hypothetical protein